MASALPANPRSWSVEHVKVFCCTEILFAGLADMMVENDVDGQTLLELTTAELRDDLKVSSLGKRKEMLRRIAELTAGSTEDTQKVSQSNGEVRLPPHAELKDSPRVTKRMALQSSLPASSPKSARFGGSKNQAAMISADALDQERVLASVETMRTATALRKTILHVLLLAPPDNRGEITFRAGPQAGQAVPKVELPVMDSEGTVSRITLMHPDAKNVSDNMRQGESYFVTNVTKKEVPQVPPISNMEFTGWLGSMVYPATKK